MFPGYTKKIMAIMSLNVLLLMLVVHGSYAHDAESSSPTAKLMRVDEGIFDIKLGQYFDLMDRKILMVFRESDNQKRNLERKIVYFRFNDVYIGFEHGARVNLKGYNAVGKYLEDKSECYMDFLDVLLPRGASPVATMRFVCE